MLIFRDMKITFATLFCFSISDTVIASSMMLFLTLYSLGCRVSNFGVKFIYSDKATKIDSEDFVNFCGLFRKHELYLYFI